MFRKQITALLAALLCFAGGAATAQAAEVDCGGVYCFSPGDFSGEGELMGICIRSLPESSVGTLMLDNRVLRPGDILTAQQLSRMTFCPQQTQADKTARLEYLAIYEDTVAPGAEMTISIRGREDKAPAAEDFALETYKNLPAAGNLKVSDPEGQALTYTVVRQPKRGTLTVGEDGSFTYTPKKNKVGVDSFVYTAADPGGNVSREATVTITILKPTDATQYTDTVGKSCRFAAEWMKNTGIFVGETLDGNACFNPDKSVTRGEFVTMLVKALEIPGEKDAVYTGYSDEIPVWLRPYLAAAVRSGLTAGLPEQETFGAAMPITGAEAAVMLQNALDLRTGELEETGLVPAWAETALVAMNGSGISLEAEETLTRGRTAEILYTASQIMDSRGNELNSQA